MVQETQESDTAAAQAEDGDASTIKGLMLQGLLKSLTSIVLVNGTLSTIKERLKKVFGLVDSISGPGVIRNQTMFFKRRGENLEITLNSVSPDIFRGAGAHSRIRLRSDSFDVFTHVKGIFRKEGFRQVDRFDSAEKHLWVLYVSNDETFYVSIEWMKEQPVPARTPLNVRAAQLARFLAETPVTEEWNK